MASTPIPLYTQGPRQRRSLSLEELEAPMGDVLRASAQDALTRSFLPSYLREQHLEDAQTGGQGAESDLAMVSAEDARERIRAENMSIPVPDEGLPKRVLEIYLGAKRREMQIQDTLNRAPSGFWPGAASLGTMLAASMLDPVNVGASFIPVIGPARYARQLEQAGGAIARAGVRARVGALEGTVGAAILEPTIYSAAQAEFADYGMADSLLAVGFGTVLGGGLHVGAGAVSDAFGRSIPAPVKLPENAPTPVAQIVRQMSTQERKDSLRIAVAQLAEGRNVELDNYVALRNELNAVRPASIEAARGQATEELLPKITADVKGKQAALQDRAELNREVKVLEGEDTVLPEVLAEVDATYRTRVARLKKDEGLSQRAAELKAKKEIRQEKEKLKTMRKNRADDVPTERNRRLAVYDDLDDLNAGRMPRSAEKPITERAQQLYRDGRFQETEVSAAVRGAIGRKWDNVVAQARNQTDAPSRISEPQLVDDMDTQLKSAPKNEDEVAMQAEVDELIESAQELADSVNVKLDDSFTAFDEELAKADLYEKGMRAAAICQLKGT